jgi:hypothetical protein
MRSDDTDNRRVRWRRWNFPKSVATPCTDSGAHAHAHAHANADTHTHTDAERHGIHDYFQRRVAKIADHITRYARDIHQQRQPRA